MALAWRWAWRTAAACVLSALATAAVASSAAAQPPPSGISQADEARRTTLFHQGFDAASAGRWGEAKERFSAALAIRSSPKVLFSLAQAEEQLGQLGAASRDYTRAIEGAKGAGENEVVSAAGDALAALRPRVPQLRILVNGASGATATLDGQPIAVGTQVAVDPGSHRVVASAPGMRDAPATVAISERQQLDLPLSLEPASPTSSGSTSGGGATTGDTTAAPSRPGMSPLRIVGIAAAGAGVVGVAVASVLGLQAKSKNDESNQSGCNGDNCTSAAASIRRDAISLANASTVLFVVSGALVAGGVVAWLVAPTPRSDEGVGVTPTAMASGGGVVVSGRW